MAHKAEAHRGWAGPEMWMLALATIVLASGSVFVIMWSPEAFGLALITGLLAVAARSVFVKVRETAHARAEASSTVANTGLVLASVAVAPLLAFAVLWAALLLLLGFTWVLNAFGVI